VVRAAREAIGGMTLEEVYQADEELQILDPLQAGLKRRFEDYAPHERYEECDARINTVCDQSKDVNKHPECLACREGDENQRKACRAKAMDRCLQANNKLCDEAFKAECSLQVQQACDKPFAEECRSDATDPSVAQACRLRKESLCIREKTAECQKRIAPVTPACVERTRPLVECEVVIRSLRTTEKVRESIEEKLVTSQREHTMASVLRIEEQEKERKRIEAEGIREFERVGRVSIVSWQTTKALTELVKSPNAKIIYMGSSQDRPPLFLDGDNLRPLAPSGSAQAAPVQSAPPPAASHGPVEIPPKPRQK
jgi:hypothetical protein